ncbi:MAG: tetrahydrofolate dehydrogenase/cyclohydrolase catalytic domain-containing protein, partial [Microgenomates group bacterium]
MLFDGKVFAKEKEEKLKQEVALLRQKGVVPKLVSVLADDSRESALYVSLKAKFAQRIGVIFDVHQFAEGTKTEEIVADIRRANADEAVHGIMIQLPVENQGEILQAISPAKDIDCLTKENLGLIVIGKPRFLPATVKAVMEIVKYALGHLGHRFEEEKWLRGKTV